MVATVATYYPARNHPFLHFDDSKYVTANSHVQDGLSWSTVEWAFTTYYASNWHPLTWLSHALDWQIFGADPMGPHEVNVLLHVVNVLLLLWVLERATGMVGRSAMVAGLFALHPINVETVAWVAERKNLLSMLFLLLALAAYGWYAKQPRAGRYVLVALLFVLGLMAKPQVITLPFLLLLWDYWPLQRMTLRAQADGKQASGPYPARSMVSLVVEKLPLFAISAVSAVITVKAQQAGGSVQSLMKFSFALRLENAIISYARYLAKAFWPSPLSPLYPFSRTAPPGWQLPASLAVLLAISGVVIAGRKYRYLTVGWLWFLGALVPMIGLVQVGVQAMADRYAYLSFIGLFVMLCWGVADLAEARHLSPAWVTGLSAGLLLILAVVTRHQLAYWSDEVRLWSHAIQTTSDNYVAEDNLGTSLLDRHDMDKAIVHFRRATAIEPHNGLSELNTGVYEERKHHWPEAIAAYKQGIGEIEEGDILAHAYSNLGYVYNYAGDETNARDSFQQALQLSPDTEQAWIGLGMLAQKSGDLAKAIQLYSHANQIRASALGYLLLARALHRSGRSEEAEAALQKARNMPGFPETQGAADGLVGR
ncbi:MAG: tetratricopeptide repeat protein [Candidatus Korobacteraceae bacterium]